MIIVAAIGIIINGATAWLFALGPQGRHQHTGRLSAHGGRCGVSAGVVVAGFIL